MAAPSLSDYKPWREVFRVHPAADKMPSPMPGEYAALKADIERNGLQMPVEFMIEGDEGVLASWSVLDGRTRFDALTDLGFRFGFSAKDGPQMHDADGVVMALDFRMLTPNEVTTPLEHVVSLNVVRRHLNSRQKRQLTGELLKESPEHSDREIGRLVGVDNKTVAAVRRHLEELGELLHQDATIGADGKWRPTERQKPAPRPRPAGPRRERAARPVDAPEIEELEAMVEKLTADLAERDHRIAGLLAENSQLKREVIGLQDELRELRAVGKVGGPEPESAHQSRAVEPPWKNGKRDYATWAKALIVPKIAEAGQAWDVQEMRWLLEDNRQWIDAYEAETPGAGSGLAARIKKAIDGIAAAATPIEDQIRSLRAQHPDWSHKEIGKAVKRASSIVARVLGEKPPLPPELQKSPPRRFKRGEALAAFRAEQRAKQAEGEKR